MTFGSCVRSRTSATRDGTSSKHPRGHPSNAGRFSSGGGGSSKSEKKTEAKKPEAQKKKPEKREHPGEGYSKEAYVVNGVIHTTEVEDAARALHQNKRVELDQPRGVSMVLDKLANVAEDMIKKGEKAPNINLCNLSVTGTNLFCVDHKGIPRIKMPQMDEEQTEKFKFYLKEKGYKVLDEEQFASHLRATQNELNGGKVAGIARSLRKQAYEAPRTVVSDDDYILDGHHRWAAKVGNDLRDGHLTNDTKIKISRVKISITKLLEEAHRFTGGKGAKGLGDRGFIDVDWDESKHPRGQPENAGQFGPGGGSAKGEEGDKAAAALAAARKPPEKPKRQLNPAVVEVGGDDWNQQTAFRLENEYQDAKPKLEELLTEYEDDELLAEGSEPPEDDQPLGPPEEWENLSAELQEQAKQEYFDQNLQEYIDQEVTSWRENGGALDEAKSQLAAGTDFQHEVIKEWIEETDQEDVPFTETKFPFTALDIADAIALEYDSDGEGGGDLKVTYNDKTLTDPISGKEDEDQLRLEGIEAPDYPKLLTKDMRIELTTMLKAKFQEKAESMASDLEAPDHFEESAKEYMEENWDHNMTDDDKFSFAKHSTGIVNDLIEQYEQGGGDASHIIGLPNKFDPLNETSGADYRKTQKVARALSLARAEAVIKERGIKFGHGAVPKKALARIDHELWDDWKGSSTSPNGQLLQVAIAEELGGRLNPTTGRGGKVTLDIPLLKRTAASNFGSIGGYDGIKAYVRAKWETTQLLLDMAGKHELHLYRGINLDNEKFAQASMESHEVEGHRKAPTLRVVRNGAASTTVSAAVANNWSSDDTRVVLRTVVPRTAAVSVPAYGINVKSEQEVVVAGTAWKGWDAWLKKAPKLDHVKMAA